MSTTAAATSQSRLKQAICRNHALSPEGLLDHLFSLAFRGLVYPQIWEDPEVDMEALAVTPECHVVTIASGGCNVLAYLIANPRQITALDLSRAHIALCRLKLAAVRHLPSWKAFYRFFGQADDAANVEAYWCFLAPRLDRATRAYWEARRCFGLGRQRISMFARDLYRHGLLGHFIGLGHALARAYGLDPRALLGASSKMRRCSAIDEAPSSARGSSP